MKEDQQSRAFEHPNIQAFAPTWAKLKQREAEAGMNPALGMCCQP